MPNKARVPGMPGAVRLSYKEPHGSCPTSSQCCPRTQPPPVTVLVEDCSLQETQATSSRHPGTHARAVHDRLCRRALSETGPRGWSRDWGNKPRKRDQPEKPVSPDGGDAGRRHAATLAGRTAGLVWLLWKHTASTRREGTLQRESTRQLTLKRCRSLGKVAFSNNASMKLLFRHVRISHFRLKFERPERKCQLQWFRPTSSPSGPALAPQPRLAARPRSDVSGDFPRGPRSLGRAHIRGTEHQPLRFGSAQKPSVVQDRLASAKWGSRHT